MTVEDFPASWRAGEKSSRSHDSGDDQRRSMQPLDHEIWGRLETWTHAFDQLAADAIRQLIDQATLGDVSESWQVSTSGGGHRSSL
jgi:hypothetical protein